MSKSDLFTNLERSLYTFNFNNIVEICYDKVVKLESNNSLFKANRLTDDEKILFDNCIDKYMQSFKITNETTNQHLEKLFRK